MSETPTERVTEQTTATAMKWVSGLVAVLGLWIAVSSFVFAGMSQASFWNNIIIGVAILLIAGYNTYRLLNERAASVASAALVTLLGLWMIVAPFVVQVTLPMLLWSDAIAGALVAILAGYNAYVVRKAERALAAGT